MVVTLSALAVAAGCRARPPSPAGPAAPPVSSPAYPQWAAGRFRAAHPGEKPLNWEIGRTAIAYHARRPMGRFVLNSNDCSDFVECIIDEALGPRPRFERSSQAHLIGERTGAFDYFGWSWGVPVQPGDLVMVAHSPWYRPYAGSIWHEGVVGSDGKVYDFVKLRSWKDARYGRHEMAAFVRHCCVPGEVTIGRLRPEFRYAVQPVPRLAGR